MHQKSHLKQMLPKYVKNRDTLKRNIKHLTNFINSDACHNVGLKSPLRPSHELTSEQMRIIVKCRAIILRNKSQLKQTCAIIESYMHISPSLHSRSSRHRRHAINETLTHIFSDSDASFQNLLDDINENSLINSDSEFRRTLSSFLPMMRSSRHPDTASSRPEQPRRSNRSRNNTIRRISHRFSEVEARAMMDIDARRRRLIVEPPRGINAQPSQLHTRNPLSDLQPLADLIRPPYDAALPENYLADREIRDPPVQTPNEAERTSQDSETPNRNVFYTAIIEESGNEAENSNLVPSNDIPQNIDTDTREGRAPEISATQIFEFANTEATGERNRSHRSAANYQEMLERAFQRVTVNQPAGESGEPAESSAEQTQPARHRVSNEQIISRINALQNRIRESQGSDEVQDDATQDQNRETAGFRVPKKVQDILDKSDCSIIDEIYDGCIDYDFDGESGNECDCSDLDCSCMDEESFIAREMANEDAGTRWIIQEPQQEPEANQTYQSESNVALGPENRSVPSHSLVQQLQSAQPDAADLSGQNLASQSSGMRFVNQFAVLNNLGRSRQNNGSEEHNAEIDSNAPVTTPESDDQNQNTPEVDSEARNMQAAILESLRDANNATTFTSRGELSAEAENALASASNDSYSRGRRYSNFQELQELRFDLTSADNLSTQAIDPRDRMPNERSNRSNNTLESISPFGPSNRSTQPNGREARSRFDTIRNMFGANIIELTTAAGRNHPLMSQPDQNSLANLQQERAPEEEEKKKKPLKPLALVGDVEPESLASLIGLKKNDRVLQFGTINSTNTAIVRSADKMASKYYEKDLPMIISRNGIEFDVFLPKHMWKGSKKIGFVWKKLRYHI